MTGVSRSGRVRKKSSKLMDFESPDEIDRPYKKQPVTARKALTDSPSVLTDFHSKKELVQQRPIKIEDDITIEEHPFPDDPNDSNNSDYDANIPYDNRSNTMSTDSLDSEQSDLDNSTSLTTTSTSMDTTAVVDNGQFQKLTDNDGMTAEGTRLQSVSHLHQQEAVHQAKNKRLVIKDGRIVSRSSNNAKGGPQRRPDNTDRSRSINTPLSSTPLLTKKLSQTLATKSPFNTTQQRTNRTTPGSQQSTSPKSTVYQLGLPTVGSNNTGVSPPSPRNHPSGAGRGDNLFKGNGIKPIDVAAHLKLLGESLTIIGERLKEHEGQIAVSGSLSVLLDSLLCALGPLLCLTQQIPELQENCCDPEQLTNTLDNVAFIMPGL